jgi:leucyl aminopeptidase (aminopeptidase T)
LSAFQDALLEEADSCIFTLGPRDPLAWTRIPRNRLDLAAVWFLERNKFVQQWMSIARRRGVKMLGIEATLATREGAKAYGFDYENWRRLMLAGCVADCAAMRRRAKRLSGLLRSNSEVRIRSLSGTDLAFRLDNRPTELSDGTISEEDARRGKVAFLPAGHVGTTVEEESAEGAVSYDSTMHFQGGRTERLSLRLRRGRIVHYEAASGASNFSAHLQSLGGDSDRFAFFGVGLNPLLRLGYGQDDKVLGVVELNFGENRSRGGRNRGKADWWGTVVGASMVIGGHRVMANGRLLV